MEKRLKELIDAVEIMFEKCPWVKEQTIYSLKQEPLNEAKELFQAIQNQDIENIEEEMGDLLYDVLLISAVAEKQGILKREKILEKVLEKIKRRKPWVFGNEKVENTEHAIKRWYDIKKIEKENKK